MSDDPARPPDDDPPLSWAPFGSAPEDPPGPLWSGPDPVLAPEGGAEDPPQPSPHGGGSDPHPWAPVASPLGGSSASPPAGFSPPAPPPLDSPAWPPPASAAPPAPAAPAPAPAAPAAPAPGDWTRPPSSGSTAPGAGRSWPPPSPEAPPPAGNWSPRSPAGDWPPDAGAPARRGTPAKAIASLVLGLLGLFVLPVVCSLAAVALGVQARRELAAHPGRDGRGVATAGLALGVLGLVLFMTFLVLGLAVDVSSA